MNTQNAHTQQGRLYVFEGPDGVGKTTLARAFAKEIADTRPSEQYSYPGNDPGTLGHLVYKLHHDARSLGVNNISPSSLQLLHVAAHIDLLSKLVVPALRSGRTVVLDRFWWSTWVYGRASSVSEAALTAMLCLEEIYLAGIVPDVVFLVD